MPSVGGSTADDFASFDMLPHIIRYALAQLNLNFSSTAALGYWTRTRSKLITVSALYDNEAREIDMFYEEMGRSFPGQMAGRYSGSVARYDSARKQKA